jgi:hypothetical protein
MVEVRLARGPRLVAMRTHRIDIGAVQQILVRIRIILRHPLNELVLPHHRMSLGDFWLGDSGHIKGICYARTIDQRAQQNRGRRNSSNIQPLLINELGPLADEVESFLGLVAHELLDDPGG